MTDDANRAQALLTDLRQSIDNLDAVLVHTLAERFRCTQTVGKLKAEHTLPGPGHPQPRVTGRQHHQLGVPQVQGLGLGRRQQPPRTP